MEMFTRLLALLLLLLAPAAAQQRFPLSPEFSQNEYSSTEGDSVRVCLNIPQLANSPFNIISCTIVVNVEAIDGTALQGVDYSLSSGGSSAQVSFTAGDAISSCFYVNLTRDCMVEGDESFELVISGSSITGQCSTFYEISELATAQFSTSDHGNDVMVVSFTQKEELVTEGEDPQVEITACSSGCTYSIPIQISVVCNPTSAVSVIPATSPEDFVAPDSFSFMFTSFGQYNSCADNSLLIRITDDEIPEPLESFICSLQSGSTQSVRSEPPEQITIDIVDNDELVVNWAKDFYSFDESSPATVELITNAAYSIGFTLVGIPVMISSGITNMPVQSTVVLPGFGRLTQPFRTVVFRNTTYEVANVGTASGRGVLRTVPSFVFSPPALSAVSSFTSVDDDICEMDQLYMAVFEPLATTGFAFGKGHPNVTYIVIEDDDVTEIAFAESNKTVNETAGSISITLTTTGAFYGPLDVVIECFTGSATSADFGQGQYTTRFFVNEQATSLESTITIPITDDSIVEGTECFVCSIVDVIGLPCARPASEGTTCNICIEDDEEDVVETEIYIEVSDYAVPENTGVLPCPILLSEPYPEPISVTIDVTTVSGEGLCENATRDVDFVANLFPVTVVIPAATTLFPFGFEIIDDNLVECNESFEFSLTYSGGQPGVSIRSGSGSGTVTIIDDDMCSVAFRNVSTMVNEDAGEVEVFVDASCASTRDYCFLVDFSGITATAGMDYSVSSSSSLLNLCILAGQTSTSFFVTVIDDNTYELTETAIANLIVLSSLASQGIILGSPSVHTFAIADNDDLVVCFDPLPLQPYIVDEGDTVLIKLATNRPFQVPFCILSSTRDGSATSPADYFGMTMSINFLVAFPMAMTMVMTNTDSLNEGVEDFTVILSVPDDKIMLPRLSVCNDSEARVIIMDTTPPPAKVFWSVPSVTVGEEDGSASLTINISRSLPEPLVVNVVCTSNTATRPMDWTLPSPNATLPPPPFPVTIPAGARSEVFTVFIVDNFIPEVTEHFTCNLVLPSPSTQPGVMIDASQSVTTVTIIDDDTIEVQFADNEIFTSESSGTARVCIVASGPVAGPGYTLVVTETGGSATTGEDYTGNQWEVVVPSGSTKISFAIPVTCDSDGAEGDETIILILEHLDNSDTRVFIGPLAVTTINIIDDCGVGRATDRSVNDTVIADPVYTVPLLIRSGNHSFEQGTPLCYEVHGEAERTFNLISDTCTSVNAFYQSARDPSAGNIITSIGILATDRSTTTKVAINITEDGSCTSVADGTELPIGDFAVGVLKIRVEPGCVRVEVDNCEGEDLVYWVRCKVLHLAFHDDAGSRQTIDQEAIKFVVGRGLALTQGAHGLVGQFWSVPVSIEPYTSYWAPSSFIDPSDRWQLTMNAGEEEERSFAAVSDDRTWTEYGLPVVPNTVCLYAGDSQGGPLGEAPNPSLGPLLEGHYMDYVCPGGIFDPVHTFTQYCCP